MTLPRGSQSQINPPSPKGSTPSNAGLATSNNQVAQARQLQTIAADLAVTSSNSESQVVTSEQLLEALTATIQLLISIDLRLQNLPFLLNTGTVDNDDLSLNN